MLNMNRDEWRYVFGLYRQLRAGMKMEADFPVLVEVQTVNRCNARCPVCPYPDTIGKQPYHLMSEEMYESILDECAQEPAFKSMILSCQNEPFVDRGLLTRARRFKEQMPGKHLQVVTNGVLMTADKLPEIYRHFDLVSISVNATSQEVFETVQLGLRWDKMEATLNAIAAVPAWRDKTILRFIKQRENIQQRTEFKRHWNQRGFRVFGFDINDRAGSIKNFRSLQIPDSASRRMRTMTLKVLSRMLSPTCPIPFITTYIRSNGAVVLCFNDYTDDLILGNVGQASIRSIFHSPRYAAIRASANRGQLHSNPLCSKCTLYKEGIWLSV